MKKIALLLTVVLALIFVMPALADTPAEEPVLLEGVVLEMTEEGYLLLTDEQGKVFVRISDDTILESNGEVACGDYLYVDYNGMMTRSLPPQVSASVIRMHKLEGDVIEWDTEANTVLLGNTEWGEVLVNLPDEWIDKEITEQHMTVYFNGAMTMSLPAQIGAGLVIPGYSVQGAVTEITDEYLLLGEGMSAVQVNLSDMELPEGLEAGAPVRVFFDGQMNWSIPAQITAESIEIIGLEAADAAAE